jgi:hypothetical protein
MVLGSLMLVLLLLGSEALAFLTAGAAISLVSRIYHRTDVLRHDTSGDGMPSTARAYPGR